MNSPSIDPLTIDSPTTDSPVSPAIELMSAMASMFMNPQYSDLTIVCGNQSYPVHRALLASRSSFFDGACRNPFQESKTGIIDLSEDDPEAVEYMVNYFYHLDYLSKRPLSRRPSQRLSQSPLNSPRFPRRGPPKKLNLALVEDPLLATMASATISTPGLLTPPAEQNPDGYEPEPFTPLDTSAKFPDTPMADMFTEDPFDNVLVEPEADVEKPHLIAHAKVYAIAEKYNISGLKTLSRQKFASELSTHSSSEEFPEACQEAYETTVETDRGLRDVIIQTFRSTPELSNRKDVELAIRDCPGLAWELFRMASGLPVSSL